MDDWYYYLWFLLMLLICFIIWKMIQEWNATPPVARPPVASCRRTTPTRVSVFAAAWTYRYGGTTTHGGSAAGDRGAQSEGKDGPSAPEGTNEGNTSGGCGGGAPTEVTVVVIGASAEVGCGRTTRTTHGGCSTMESAAYRGRRCQTYHQHGNSSSNASANGTVVAVNAAACGGTTSTTTNEGGSAMNPLAAGAEGGKSEGKNGPSASEGTAGEGETGCRGSGGDAAARGGK